jgi:hypothetical protein
MAERHLIGQELIRKNLELFSLATNAEPRLREDHPQSNADHAMTFNAKTFSTRVHLRNSLVCRPTQSCRIVALESKKVQQTAGALVGAA